MSFTAWAAGETHPEVVWDVSDEPPPELPAALLRMTTDGPDERPADGEDALDMKMGALDNSFLVRGNAVDVFRNRAGGALADANVRVKLADAAGEYITPTKGILANQESSMLLLSPDTGRRDKLYQMDLEREQVVSEWGCVKDGVHIPMSDIQCDTKSSQMESRSTFLGLDDNRLVRWDMRLAGGVAQEMASPTLGYKDGHDFAHGTKFRCMATTGDGASRSDRTTVRFACTRTRPCARRRRRSPVSESPITAIDVTHDGKWILATTDTCLVLLHTCVRDAKTQELTNGFRTRAGERIAAPRLLKLKPEDAARARGAPLTRGKFTWVTEQGKQERWIVASCQNYSILFNFRRVKAATAPDERLMEYTEYSVVDRVRRSRSRRSCTRSSRSRDTHLVIATKKGDVFCAGG